MATVVRDPAPGVEPGPPPVPEKDGRIRSALRETGELTAFMGGSIAALPGALTYFSEAMRQAAMMMKGTLLLLFVMNAFLGSTLGNFAFFLLRGIGASDFLGLVSGYGAPRQLATTMFGYVFTAKICCGMAAELGAMKIQQEVDALESTGVDPRRYLVGTRLTGVLLFVPVACAVSLCGILFGTLLTTVGLLQGISTNTLLSVHWGIQSVGDQLFALVTMMSIALFSAMVACFYGLRTTGGPANVGSSVAKSLVINLVVLHVIAVVYAILVYGVDQKLPIGG